MSTKIHAYVRRLPRVGGTPLGEQWLTVVFTTSTDPNAPADFYETNFAGSHPEAVQIAHKLRAQFDRDLMDRVHASRARRRTEPAA